MDFICISILDIIKYGKHEYHHHLCWDIEEEPLIEECKDVESVLQKAEIVRTKFKCLVRSGCVCWNGDNSQIVKMTEKQPGSLRWPCVLGGIKG